MRTNAAAPPSARPDPATRPARSEIVSAWLTSMQFRWDDVIAGARTRQFAREETLFLEGQAADTVYVIMAGRVRLTAFGFDGHERHLMIVGPNGLVGDCALPSTRHYVVSAVAAADSDVVMVPAGRMLDALAQHPVLSEQHRALSAMRFRIMLRHVVVQGSNSSRRRVCLHLLDLVNSYGAPHRQGSVISISFTQQEMGSICGLSRVSVSHIFTQLERGQIIARSGRLVVIVDLKSLEALAKD